MPLAVSRRSRPGEIRRVHSQLGSIDAPKDQRPNLFDQRNGPGTLALRPSICESTRHPCSLTPKRPHPLISIDIVDPATGDLADPSGCASGEYYRITPALVLASRCDNQSLRKALKGDPIRQGFPEPVAGH